MTAHPRGSLRSGVPPVEARAAHRSNGSGCRRCGAASVPVEARMPDAACLATEGPPTAGPGARFSCLSRSRRGGSHCWSGRRGAVPADRCFARERQRGHRHAALAFERHWGSSRLVCAASGSVAGCAGDGCLSGEGAVSSTRFPVLATVRLRQRARSSRRRLDTVKRETADGPCRLLRRLRRKPRELPRGKRQDRRRALSRRYQLATR